MRHQNFYQHMSQLIFVTGASGFLGSHIVEQLLSKGFRVRAAARGAKVDELKQSYSNHGDKFDAVGISDITVDQFPDALVGVDAVIHTASPLPERSSNADIILKGAIEGTLNVVRQAHLAGIKRIVVTSSIASVANPNNSFTDQDWYPVDEGNQSHISKFDTYRAAKTIAEKELWAFSDAHPDVDITTINPPFLYGPFAPGFRLPKPDYYALSTNLHIFRLLKPSSSFPTFPGYADVRDTATAHILALSGPPSATSSIGRKRVIFCSPYSNAPKNVVKIIRDNRPALKDRIIQDTPPTLPLDRIPIDYARVEEVLGFGKADFRSIEETILDTVDSLLVIEKEWADQGHEINIPDQ